MIPKNAKRPRSNLKGTSGKLAWQNARIPGELGRAGPTAQFKLDPSSPPARSTQFAFTLQDVNPISCLFSLLFRSSENHQQNGFEAPRGHQKINEHSFASLFVTLQKNTPDQILFFLFLNLSGDAPNVGITLKRFTVCQNRRSHLPTKNTNIPKK